MKPRLLDLFCGAGGAAMGYHRAGFEVVGVDIKPQPHYPFEFHQADALTLHPNQGWSDCYHMGDGSAFGGEWYPCVGMFQAVHASPPCQVYSRTDQLNTNEHPDLIADVRRMLANMMAIRGIRFVIENVPGAPLIDPIRLEGQMFGLGTNRPRLFECSFPLDVPALIPPPLPQAKMGRRPKEGESIQVVGHFIDVEAARKAMDIDWMSRDELSQAIPPAYTAYIGGFLMAALEAAS